MKLEVLRHEVDCFNRAYWYATGEIMEGKYCKIHGWVALNFDCEGCSACEQVSPI